MVFLENQDMVLSSQMGNAFVLVAAHVIICSFCKCLPQVLNVLKFCIVLLLRYIGTPTPSPAGAVTAVLTPRSVPL